MDLKDPQASVAAMVKGVERIGTSYTVVQLLTSCPQEKETTSV